MVKKPAKDKKEIKKEKLPKELSNSRIMLDAALGLVEKSKLQALLLYVDGLQDMAELASIDFSGSVNGYNSCSFCLIRYI